jgi:cephalosporin hydroxylase
MELLPPAVEADLASPLHKYWLDREAQHVKDVYAGVRIQKMPEDLRVYEHLLWISRADTVIELGTNHGGSALWFRDRLNTLATTYGRIAEPAVISIDVDHTKARRAIGVDQPGITLLTADLADEDLLDRVRALLKPDARCLVVEDTLHAYETTRAALDGFARFVPLNGFFVVEDGIVDVPGLRPDKDLPRGVLPAVNDFLATDQGRAFRVRRDLERYGLTCFPGGYLERVSPRDGGEAAS